MESTSPSSTPKRLTDAAGARSVVLRGHYLLATWFGCGLSKIAPGTVGSLGAVPLLWALFHWQLLWLNLALIVVLSVAGAWSAHAVARHRDEEDPGLVVIDEVAGVDHGVGDEVRDYAPPGSLGAQAAECIARLVEFFRETIDELGARRGRVSRRAGELLDDRAGITFPVCGEAGEV